MTAPLVEVYGVVNDVEPIGYGMLRGIAHAGRGMEDGREEKGNIDVTRRVQQLVSFVSNRLSTKGPGSSIRLVPVGYLAMISFVAKLARSPQGVPVFSA